MLGKLSKEFSVTQTNDIKFKFCDMGKLDKASLAQPHPSGCRSMALGSAGLSSCYRLWGPQSLKYLLSSGPSQKSLPAHGLK